MLGENVFSSLADGEDEPSASEYDPDSYYLVRPTLAFFWPYDETGKMIGEHVYEDTESKVVTEVEASDVITGPTPRSCWPRSSTSTRCPPETRRGVTHGAPLPAAESRTITPMRASATTGTGMAGA